MVKILELFVETCDWKSDVESGVKIQDSPDKKKVIRQYFTVSIICTVSAGLSYV